MSKRKISLRAKSDDAVVITGRIYREQENLWLIELAPNSDLYRASKTQWNVIPIEPELPEKDGIYVPSVAARSTSPFIFIREFGDWSICNSHGNFPGRTADSILEEFFDAWGGLTRLVPEDE